MTLQERLWSKVDMRGPMSSPYLGPCWVWGAAKTTKGYGVIRVAGRLVAAHRLAYELVRGAIPDGLEPDHLCRHHACVNPAHMEPVTRSENIRRGKAAARKRAWAASKTHCPHGHRYHEANTYRHRGRDGYTRRQCRTCRGERVRT